MDKEFHQQPDDSDQMVMPENFTSAMEVVAAYAPPFAFLVSLGFGIIYAITVNGFPNIDPPVELLWLAIAAAIAGVAYLLVPLLIKRRKLVFAEAVILFSYELFILTVAFLWNVPQTYLHLLIWVFPILILWLCDNNKQRIIPLVSGLVGSLGVFILARFNFLGQRPVDSFISTVSAFYLLFAIAAWIGLIIVVRIIPFKRLTARLTTSFFLLVMIPTVITALIAAFQSYARDTNNIYVMLDSTTMVKEQQINQIINGMFQDLGFLLRDPVAKQRFEFVFASEPNAAISKINKSIVLGYLNNVIEQTGSKYEEAFLLDTGGNVILSNIPETIGRNYESQTFFKQGLLQPFSTTETEIAEFGPKAFLVSEAIKDNNGKTVGVIALRSRFDAFEEIVKQPSGTGVEDESYLVGENLNPLSNTLAQPEGITSIAVLNAINGRQSGYDTYQNYANVTVLGAYRWLPGLRAGVISEVASSKALQDTISLISTIFTVGLVAILLVMIAVYQTARTISTPISSLANTAVQLSAGDLSSRSSLLRSDEIGQLALSFNGMADRLQDFITSLEQKIAERTRDIQRQAVRLRVASEISRDSATATELKELLNRSAQLIRERFGYYHSGIFLLDDNREFAVLSAASSDAGRLMLETGFKVRVGDGIVGYVAQTGESRIALDTGADKIFSKNPLLPATRSELGLPLKVYSRVIGILDVQSDLQNAFSEDDIATLQIMADQLAVAIERTRVYQDSQDSLRELKRSYQGYTEESWSSLARSRKFIAGYMFEGVSIRPLATMPGEAVEIFKTGAPQMVTDSTGRQKFTRLSVPVKIRGETIGMIRLNIKGETIPDDTIAMIEEIIGRLGVALETSRLVYESRQLADRERSVSEASARIGSSIDFEDILRSAVEELGKIMGESEVIVQLASGNPVNKGLN
jgi:GAF domain-containing protein/HAMP domain-containing protein